MRSRAAPAAGLRHVLRRGPGAGVASLQGGRLVVELPRFRSGRAMAERRLAASAVWTPNQVAEQDLTLIYATTLGPDSFGGAVSIICIGSPWRRQSVATCRQHCRSWQPRTERGGVWNMIDSPVYRPRPAPQQMVSAG